MDVKDSGRNSHFSVSYTPRKKNLGECLLTIIIRRVAVVWAFKGKNKYCFRIKTFAHIISVPKPCRVLGSGMERTPPNYFKNRRWRGFNEEASSNILSSWCKSGEDCEALNCFGEKRGENMKNESLEKSGSLKSGKWIDRTVKLKFSMIFWISRFRRSSNKYYHKNNRNEMSKHISGWTTGKFVLKWMLPKKITKPNKIVHRI